MARITDLPAELFQRIIDHLGLAFPHDTNLGNKHVDVDHADHDGRRDIRQKARSHLEYKDAYGSSPHPQVSWPDALPSNPLLPLCLVNSTFRQFAQEALFTNVALLDQWQAYLFHRTLTSPSPNDEGSEVLRAAINEEDEYEAREHDLETSRSSAVYPPRLNKLARHVRALQFRWAGHCSMGRGGGSLICEILQSCPLLESITIGTSFLTRCKEPILQVLASRQFIKEFVVLENPNAGCLTFQWQAHEVVGRLFFRWKFLETIEFIRLPGWPYKDVETIYNSIPALNCALRTIVLNEPSLSEKELSMILKSSRESLRTLQISCPTSLLDRPGLYRILKECTSPNLESLTLEVGRCWHPIPSSARIEGANDSQINPGLLDFVFKSSSALTKIKVLSITGPLAGSEFFDLLPQSIVKLTWNRCDLQALAFADALSGRRLNENLGSPPEIHCSPPDYTFSVSEHVQWLPNLKCCSVGDTITWSTQDLQVILRELEARQVCFHPGPGRIFSADRGRYERSR
ncbi:hypothetical protein PTTG_29179 [Puccinia triticina 1-1 BBBD Race 1]|uniref:Uncharacterized protein n=2 Tax=Puccinia triticina TaxID=208348 RepID=A0A180G614_PUCT1|nr:uncharacterized protein PtA15_5A86 [Puccinia triticina]OAV88034.1 hypothetical protein PTTG_29179 [Puccinia triticina 1-1 BBBD Race 1]WAQ84516.1 hypothetical protein PtA15_5A86 [Puccinia triticina]WAR57856.1 hypothetical protein PtB15_5B86 [Puccinia triticina]